MSDIPKVDRSQQELTDGSPVPADRSHTRDRGDGQQVGYIVLTAEERAKGFVKPLRRSYTHNVCGGLTTMGTSLAETYARDPNFYSGTFCCGYSTHFDLDEFTWEDGEPMDPTLQDEWQRTEGERRRKAKDDARQKRIAELNAEIARLQAEASLDAEPKCPRCGRPARRQLMGNFVCDTCQAGVSA